jgi:hypothetical protein
MNLLYDIYNSIYSAFNIPIGEFWKVTLTTGWYVFFGSVVGWISLPMPIRMSVIRSTKSFSRITISTILC